MSTDPQDFEKTQAWQSAAGLGVTQAFDAPLKLAEDQPTEASPTTQLGDFQLLSRLGVGGMGQVYKALQVSKNREVAVKVLAKSISTRSGFLERFQREARVMGKLNHPHIVKYFAAGESQGWFYLAMELVDGGSVGSRLKQLGRLPVADTVRLMMQACDALYYAHQLGMVHRDVKPDNLLLTADGLLKLADLGLAKTVDDTEMELTGTGQGMGTPLYAAPEQTIDAKRADARSDLYALGCVMYECLTGKPPFEGNNLLDLLQQKQQGTFTLPSLRIKGLPAVLDKLCIRMMAKLPEHRFATLAEARQELDRTGLAS